MPLLQVPSPGRMRKCCQSVSRASTRIMAVGSVVAHHPHCDSRRGGRLPGYDQTGTCHIDDGRDVDVTADLENDDSRVRRRDAGPQRTWPRIIQIRYAMHGRRRHRKHRQPASACRNQPHQVRREVMIGRHLSSSTPPAVQANPPHMTFADQTPPSSTSASATGLLQPDSMPGRCRAHDARPDS